MRVYKTDTIGGCPTIEELIEARKDLLEKYPSADNFEVVVVNEYGCEYIGLEYSRDPTEVELAERELAKERALDREKVYYLKLKEKFGE